MTNSLVFDHFRECRLRKLVRRPHFWFCDLKSNVPKRWRKTSHGPMWQLHHSTKEGACYSRLFKKNVDSLQMETAQRNPGPFSSSNRRDWFGSRPLCFGGRVQASRRSRVQSTPEDLHQYGQFKPWQDAWDVQLNGHIPKESSHLIPKL